ncbi:hydrogenase maturation nickel metallochaperone HypA [Edaphovirga cremea]|jgi:hydrogenase nickel incorporation protein HypA/HybF|uniref:hydrogenase maturation nickel metallochaperone HypA n=1 Tax=Edaphovirga cremea TaxID=2267246 RepID=UPI000DEFD784|nr:hydrogenase maturation nickel metallochaperone HypA [Edaphovirga cremea]
MHEISLCQSALELIEQQAQNHGAQRVTAVWIEIGVLSCVEESALAFCFESVCRHTVAEGCQLHLSYRNARAWCWDCSQEVAVTRHDAPCPVCSGHRLRIEGGDSLQIKQMEVE